MRAQWEKIAWAFAQFLLLLAALYVVRPLRDEMGIASGVENMQWLFTGTFVGIVIVVPIYGAAVARLGRRVLVPIIYLGLAASLLLCFAGGRRFAAAIFVWISVFNMLTPSVFWSLMADLFTQEEGRRRFGLIAAGGSIGALLGPTVAAVGVRRLLPEHLLVVAAALLVAAAACAWRLHRVAAADDEAAAPLGGSLWGGFGVLFRTPLLRGISIYLLCMTWVNTIFYFEQAHIVAASITDAAERTALFAEMDLAVNVGSLVVQVLLTGLVIRRLGLTATLVALPVVAVAALFALASAPVLGVLVVVQVVRRACNFALSKPAREILFTHVCAEAKYKGKNVVDTFVYRGGDAAAGWGFRGLEAVGLGLSSIAGASVAIAIVWALVARRLGTLAR